MSENIKPISELRNDPNLNSGDMVVLHFESGQKIVTFLRAKDTRSQNVKGIVFSNLERTCFSQEPKIEQTIYVLPNGEIEDFFMVSHMAFNEYIRWHLNNKKPKITGYESFPYQKNS